MLDPYLQKVIVLGKVSRPLEQPTDRDWHAVERDLGRTLPGDFKRIVTELGTGRFGEFGLHNPTCSSKYARLSRSLLMQFREWHARDQMVIPLYPDPQGY